MTTVITYGTFDLFHQGHYNILKRAKELGDYLIVGVTADSFDIDRGKLNVKDSLLERIAHVRESGFADKIIVEEYQGQKLQDIKKYKVDIFAVGSDWKGKFDYIGEYCDIVYLERTRNISSTQLRQKGKIHRIGIVTNKDDDNDTVVESKLVSGLNCEAVYHPDQAKAEAFGEKYQLDFATSDFEAFLDRSDILFFQMEPESDIDFQRLILDALDHEKQIIFDGYSIHDQALLEEVFAKAAKVDRQIFDNITIAYNRQFDQLLWYLKGNVIGDLVSVNINVDADAFENGAQSIDKILYLSLYVSHKILEGKLVNISRFDSKDGRFTSIYLKTDTGEAKINVGKGYDLVNKLEIIGSRGRVSVPEDWWNLRYYRVSEHNSDQIQRFTFNYDGNGKRYLFMDVIAHLEAKETPKYKVAPEDSIQVASVLSDLREQSTRGEL